MDLNHTFLLRHKPGHLCLILVSRSETVCVFDWCARSCCAIFSASKTKVSNATVTKVSDCDVRNPRSKPLNKTNWNVRFLGWIFVPLFSALCLTSWRRHRLSFGKWIPPKRAPFPSFLWVKGQSQPPFSLHFHTFNASKMVSFSIN